MTEHGIGASVRRREDLRFLTGRGTYVDDMTRPRQLHAWFVHSPHPHATVAAVDTAAAGASPGVVAVFTGADLAADDVGGLPCGFAPDGGPIKEPLYPALAKDRVRFVGDRVAVVIAETRDQARDAAEAIEIDYRPLPHVVGAVEALQAGAPVLHDDAPGNLCFDWQIGDKAAADAAFAGAAHVTGIDLVNNRKVPNAIEPRACIGEYDAGSDRYTLYSTTQNPHVIRLLLAAFVLKIPEHRLRVVSPDVGGGFGSKIPHYAEEAVVTWAARKVGRPVKWTAERSASFLTDTHGRDHVTRAEIAVDGDGRFLALRVDTVANLGAYLSTFGPLVPTYLYATLLAGQYRTPTIHCRVRAAFTNTAPVDAERGAGRPEATFVVERLVEAAGRETGLGAAEIRRRNFVAPDAFPHQTPVALQYDSGNYPGVLDKALALAAADGFAARRAESERRGKLRGFGLSAYIEACGLAPSNVAGAIGARAGLYEAAEVRMHPTGSVTVFTGSHSHGQSHDTTFAQIVAERLGVPLDAIEIVHGDTDRVPFGMGTYGSRSLAVGGSAIVRAIDKIVDKGKKIAAFAFEAAEADIRFEDGHFSVAGTDKRMSIGEVAMSAYVPHNYPLDRMEPGLDESCFYDPVNFTFPNGCHVCEVEVDPDTGAVEIVAYSAVDDVGRIVNPMIVEGQIHGGVVHGIGQALCEQALYDGETGQLVTGAYTDYAMPRADMVPGFAIGHQETPCPHNPLGVKGAGEAGAIAAPAAVINAVVDALSVYGIRHVDMPATPEKVWRAIRAARSAAAE